MRVRAGRLSVVMLLSLALAAAVGRVHAEESCLKLVFGRYCLAGDIARLQQTAPQPVDSQSRGDSLALVYPEGTDQIYVLAFSGRIYKVVRAYRVSTQLRFDDLRTLLSEKYGPAEDHSQFPDSATSPSRRMASIRRGEGRAVQVWRPSPEWRIELGWTRELGLSVSYIANAIEAERAAKADGGL